MPAVCLKGKETKNMDIFNINKVLDKAPKFRLKQAYECVFKNLLENWQEATSFPRALRDELKAKAPLAIAAEVFADSDKRTVRALFTEEGDSYEAVLMRHLKRNTVCVSTQAGCAMACAFCATGKLGFKRNLAAAEIVKQVLFFARRLSREGERVNNVVYMGMGEPFNNYDEVIKSVRVINDESGLNIGARRISISTVGVVPGINRLAKESLQVNLAVSLHATDNQIRDRLMPVNSRYDIASLLKAVKNYQKASNRKVMIEYVMLKDINDQPEHAKALAELLKKNLAKGLYCVNLVSYNQTKGFLPSPPDSIKSFKAVLERGAVPVVERYKFGYNIKAACGQLAGTRT